MQKELYFDISKEESGGSLYRLRDAAGKDTFLYEHSRYDADRDEIKVFTTEFALFADFWQMLTKDAEWYYQHPLFVHPEQRAFVREQLSKVNWGIYPDEKWQESHQQQWKKVLSDREEYYWGRGY